MELGQIIAGPIVSLILADLGATVVKVEHPAGGDRMRTSGAAGDAMFQTMNRNKRSVTLDLKSDSGREVYERLAADADVVIENLGPGAVESLGIGYDDLSEGNPGLIYLSVKGFFEGPYGDRASMDVVAEAMSGFMQMTGEKDGKPLRAGTSVADIAAGLYGAIAITVALAERERTGEGQKLTAGMFESLTNWMWYWTAYAQFQGRDPEPLGASHPAMAVYDVFQTADDEWIFIGVVSDPQWEDICEVLDRPDLLAADRFETAEDRLDRKQELLRIVQSDVGGWDRDELLEELYDVGIPAAPLTDPSGLIDDPHLAQTGLLAEPGRDDGGDFQALLTPVVGDRIEPANRRRPPKLGEHTDEILAEFGLDQAEIDAYRESSAFGSSG